MARKKISEFSETLNPSLSGITQVVQDNTNYKVTLETLKGVFVAYGSSGTSGTSGANGSSGTSGINGTNGTSGSNGTSGTSGTSADPWTITNISYSELVDLVSSSGLTPTATYRLYDFQTVHYMLDGKVRLNDIHMGEIEPLYLTANSYSTFNPDVYSEIHTHDVIRYDWNPNNWIKDLGFANAEALTGSGVTIDLSAVSIVPGFKGVIHKREDTKNNNVLGYDFRNVKFRRWKFGYPLWDSGSTYNIKDIVHIPNTGAFSSLIDNNTDNYITDINYWNRIIDYSTTPYLCVSSANSSNPSDFIDVYTFAQLNSHNPVSIYEWFVKNNNFEIYKDTYDQLNGNIGSILSNNVFYLSDDYSNSIIDNLFDVFFELNTIDVNYKTNDVRHNFHSNVIGRNFTSNIINHNFNSNFITNDFYDNTIEGYFQTNHISSGFSRNFISDYFQNNNIGIDFLSNTIGNTFDTNSVKYSAERNNIADNFINNKIGYNFIENVIINFFQSNNVGNNCIRNRVGNCGGNTIGNSFTSNYIDDTFFYNVIGNSFSRNKISNFFQSNVISNHFKNNIINPNFTGNTIADYFSGNTIDNQFKGNSISTGFTSNTIGEAFALNVIGSDFRGNTVSAECSSNAIGDSFKYNAIGGDFKLNIIQDYFMGNVISSRFYNNNIEDYFSTNSAGINVTNLNIPTYGAITGNTFSLNDIRNGFDGAGIDFSVATHAYGDYNCELFRTSTGTFKLKYVDGSDDTIKIVNANT